MRILTDLSIFCCCQTASCLCSRFLPDITNCIGFQIPVIDWLLKAARYWNPCFKQKVNNFTHWAIWRQILARKLFGFSGTLWCGDGTLADEYEQLGMFKYTDACCRGHDHCNDSIPTGETRHGLHNSGLFTRWELFWSFEPDSYLWSCKRFPDQTVPATGNFIGVWGRRTPRYHEGLASRTSRSWGLSASWTARRFTTAAGWKGKQA